MAVSAHGTLMKIGDGSDPDVYATIGEVLDITGPSMTLNTETVTSHDSIYEQVIPTIVASGEVTFDINYTGDASQTVLEDALTSRALTSFQVTFPLETPEVRTFDAYVTGLEFAAPVEGVMRASITLTRSGQMVKS